MPKYHSVKAYGVKEAKLHAFLNSTLYLDGSHPRAEVVLFPGNKIWFGKPQVRSLGGFRLRWEDNIKMNFVVLGRRAWMDSSGSG
jgi:hypothetical protein